jgi:hypothetical protein
VKLDRNRQVVEIRESTRLRFARDSGPLTCEVKPQELHCNSNAKRPEKSIDIRVKMELPYAILWPLSVFSMGGLTGAVDQPLGRATSVQVVRIEELNPTLPVLPMRADGLIELLGREEITIGSHEFLARKYELRTPVQPGRLQIWVSPEGLVLAIEKMTRPRARLDLARLTMPPDFWR